LILDGKDIGVVDYYSQARVNNALIFETNDLTDGEHTLVIKVLETKNPHSSGNFVTADYAVCIKK
jgi:hypothetical protein